MILIVMMKTGRRHKRWNGKYSKLLHIWILLSCLLFDLMRGGMLLPGFPQVQQCVVHVRDSICARLSSSPVSSRSTNITKTSITCVTKNFEYSQWLASSDNIVWTVQTPTLNADINRINMFQVGGVRDETLLLLMIVWWCCCWCWHGATLSQQHHEQQQQPHQQHRHQHQAVQACQDQQQQEQWLQSQGVGGDQEWSPAIWEGRGSEDSVFSLHWELDQQCEQWWSDWRIWSRHWPRLLLRPGHAAQAQQSGIWRGRTSL